MELIFWSQAFATRQIETLLAGEMPSTADALVHGVPLRTVGLLAEWQDELRRYPARLAANQIGATSSRAPSGRIPRPY